MNLELAADERDQMLELLEARIRDLRVEIRRAERHEYHDELTTQMKCLERLVDKLETSPWDVTA